MAALRLVAVVLSLLAAGCSGQDPGQGQPEAAPRPAGAGDPDPTRSPEAPGRPCGLVPGVGGGQERVSVVGATPCGQAEQLVTAYAAAPDRSGNALLWTSPDGWECSSPTAAGAADGGHVTACRRDGETVLTRSP